MRPAQSARCLNGKFTSALLATLTLGVAGTAFADLKAAPPDKVNLTALWKVNAELSDDPQKIIAKKRTENTEQGGARGGRGTRGTSSGTDVGEIFGEIIRQSTGKGSSGSSDKDTEGTDASPPESMRVPLDSFLATREEFEIEQRPDAVTVRSIDESNTCKTGSINKVTLPNAEVVDQTCGWQGATFVVELKSPDGVTRTNRYELRKSGKQLLVTSVIKGGHTQFSGLQIKRVYDRLVAF